MVDEEGNQSCPALVGPRIDDGAFEPSPNHAPKSHPSAIPFYIGSDANPVLPRRWGRLAARTTASALRLAVWLPI